MASLPIAQPQQLDKYGRDPQSPSERLRKRTDYAKGTGWAPLFHAMVADIPRLSRGSSCTNLILAVLALQDRSAGGSGRTDGLTLEEWAQLACCDPKEVQRNRDYLRERKMADCGTICDQKTKIWRFTFKLRPENWQALEDYKTWAAKQKTEETAAEDATAEDAAETNKPGNWRMSKPIIVKPGAQSRTFKPDCGIAEFQFATPKSTPSGVGVAYFGVVRAGKLVITPTITLEVKATGEVKKRDRVGDMGVLDPCKHPRAAEVTALFDPLLEKSGSQLLKFPRSQSTLQKACEALGEVDHDWLVHFVNVDSGRAGRPISGPRAVVGICQDAKRAFLKKPVKSYSDADIQRMIAEERAARKAKRA